MHYKLTKPRKQVKATINIRIKPWLLDFIRLRTTPYSKIIERALIDYLNLGNIAGQLSKSTAEQWDVLLDKEEERRLLEAIAERLRLMAGSIDAASDFCDIGPDRTADEVVSEALTNCAKSIMLAPLGAEIPETQNYAKELKKRVDTINDRA